MNNQINRLTDVSAEKIKLASRINHQVIQVSLAEKNIILATSDEEIEEYEVFIENLRNEISEHILKLRKFSDDATQKNLDQFNNDWNAYLKINRKLLKTARLNSNVKARALSQGEARRAYTKASLTIAQMVEKDDEESTLANDVITLKKIAERIKLAARINRNLVEIQRGEKDIILATSQEIMDKFSEKIKIIKEELLVRLELLQQMSLGENRDLVNRFKREFDSYILLHEEVRALSRENSNTRAFELSSGTSRVQKDKVLTQMSAIVDNIEKDLEEDKSTSDETYLQVKNALLSISILGILASIVVALTITSGISRSLSQLRSVIFKLSQGQAQKVTENVSPDEIGEIIQLINQVSRSLDDITQVTGLIASNDFNQKITQRSEQDLLVQSINNMATNLLAMDAENSRQNWLRDGQNLLNDKVSGDLSIADLSQNIIQFLAEYLNVQMGTIYVIDENSNDLKLSGSYAFSQRKSLNANIKMGDGLVGQAAYEKKTISVTSLPPEYTHIRSSVGDAAPSFAIVIPVIFENQILAVIELAAFEALNTMQHEFLQRISANLSVLFNAAFAREKTQTLLLATQRQTEDLQAQSEELQAQQEELQASNEELEEQTQRLQASEEELQAQSEELRASNEQLQQQTQSLKKQKTEIELASRELEEKSEDLTRVSKYKSEFLANMSHELRTPLNSFLLLSKGLHNNKKGNLDEEQLEDLQIIHDGGKDLLNLINDIMDLSKVEAGKLTIQREAFPVIQICENMRRLFRASAEDRKLEFRLECDGNDIPAQITSDSQRLEQILKNLLANAFKFTDEGYVALSIHQADPATRFLNSNLTTDESIVFSISDTGCGIPPDKQKEIFEAFQQSDGSTSRKYGGTGLGLTISRELAYLLGGEIQLQSTPDEGSTFSLYLPKRLECAHLPEDKGLESATPVKTKAHTKDIIKTPHPNDSKADTSIFIDDDRDNIDHDDQLILVIEDDLILADQLLKIIHLQNLKGIVAGDGKNGLYLAMQFSPAGIFLDLGLPDIDGRTVLEQLKFHLKTKHIPVHIITGQDGEINNLQQQLRQEGAIGYLKKPVSEETLNNALQQISRLNSSDIKTALIVEDDQNTQIAVSRLIQHKGMKTQVVNSGIEAIKLVQSNNYDCLILDIDLPDISGFEVLDRLSNDSSVTAPPIIVYTGSELTAAERDKLHLYSANLVMKDAETSEKLLDEALMFLHSVTQNLTSDQKKIVYNLHDESRILEGRKILLVDDDMRNTFSLSKRLQEIGLEIYIADNGKTALGKLAEKPDIELIIMDIMMPVMDGYEAMRAIRKQQKFINTPIIALTAKAMSGDREKAINAGATDYLTKPLDFEKLLSMLKVWLFKK